MEAPNYSTDANSHPVSKLKRILIEQQEELTNLCTVVEYLRGFLHVGIDESDLMKYQEKLANFKNVQQERFHRIDELINENIYQMKKELTVDQTVLVYGKEVRKLEAGLRTLLLFTSDVIEMLKRESTVNNRSEERIRYFDTRSAAIDVEIRILLQKMTFL